MQSLSKSAKYLFFIFLILAESVSARYYVSKQGNDNNNGQTWENAFNTISRAVSLSGSDNVIWVAKGTYTEIATIDVPTTLSLYGGFAGYETDLTERDFTSNKTIIDGENKHRCVVNAGLFDGFQIKNGMSWGGEGAGIYNYGIVNNCELSYNIAMAGGGIYNFGGTVKNCDIFSNAASPPSHGGCAGAGIYNEKGDIYNCRVYNNRGNGVYSSNSGGIHNNYGRIYNCLIYKNDSRASYWADGGGVTNKGGVIINSTIFANTSSSNLNEKNAGITNSGIIINSIAWGNSDYDISDISGVSFSCFKESDGLNGNINVDPLFVNTSGNVATWNFHLQKGSLCIDSGTTDGASLDDFDGIHRFWGSGCDMGAYEYYDMLGDMNFDKNLDDKDIEIYKKSLLGAYHLNYLQTVLFNINDDGYNDIADLIAVFNLIGK